MEGRKSGNGQMVRIVLTVTPFNSLILWYISLCYRSLDDMPKKMSNTEGKLVLGKINEGSSSENLDLSKPPQILLLSVTLNSL
jgi:hypothetical protein